MTVVLRTIHSIAAGIVSLLALVLFALAVTLAVLTVGRDAV